jgi:hypothetical protein
MNGYIPFFRRKEYLRLAGNIQRSLTEEESKDCDILQVYQAIRIMKYRRADTERVVVSVFIDELLKEILK